jgi:hypothetical protein
MFLVVAGVGYDQERHKRSASQGSTPTAAPTASAAPLVVNKTGHVLVVGGRRLNPNESMRADPKTLTVQGRPCRVMAQPAEDGSFWLICADDPPTPRTPTPPPYPTFGRRSEPAQSYADRQQFVIKALGDAATAQEKWRRTVGEYVCTLENLEAGPDGGVGPDLNVRRVGYKLMLFRSGDSARCASYVLVAAGQQPGDPHFCVQPGHPVCESEEHPSDDDSCVCK